MATPEPTATAELEARLARIRENIAQSAIYLCDLESCPEVDADHLVDQENTRRALRRLGQLHRQVEEQLRQARGVEVRFVETGPR